jgi:uroporphyrinogen decarboxylase
MSISPLINVLKKKTPKRRPVWFMRQAGRYLPEYRRVRERAGSFLDLCYSPELAAEVTLQPLKRFDLDAAIVFADILVVPQAMGLGVRFTEGEGPVVDRITGPDDMRKLKPLDEAWEVSQVCKTLNAVKPELREGIALIGFCGAPWTVASYMVGGGGVEGREDARKVALEGSDWFGLLTDRLIEASASYLIRQIEAGADVVQIFDSWAGDLPGYAQKRLVADPIAAIVKKVKAKYPDFPVIVFARGVGAGHRAIGEATRADGLSIETSSPLTWAAATLAADFAVQGNLDPLAVEAGGNALAEGVETILEAMPRDRHIFNLGHGMRPATPPAHVEQVIARIRAFDGR